MSDGELHRSENKQPRHKSAQKWSGGNTGAPDHPRQRDMVFTKYGEEPVYNKNTMRYLAYGKELTPTTNRVHWQGFVYWKHPQSIKGASKKLNGAHVEYMEGDFDDNTIYCSKDGEYKEFGTRPEQGRRVDLEELGRQILEGKETAESILIKRPMTYHQYGRTLEKLEAIRRRKEYRTEMTEGIWIVGASGAGKSHHCLSDYDPETHYLYKDDNGWWEGYRQQPIVVINDFKGEIKYGVLLQLIDKWPFFVKRRNYEPMPFTSKRVIITSIMRPEEVYHNLHAKDGIEQLLRRLKIITID